MRRTVGNARGANISRGDFLRLGGAGLAGAALLGSGALAGCGSSSSGGSGDVVFSWGPDDTGTLPKLIDEFNRQNKGNFRVRFREMPSDSGQYFDQLRTEFQAGGGEVDVIGGDVIWPAQFAATGYLLDLSDRFPASEREKFLPAPMQAMTFEGKPYGVPWYTDAGLLYYREDLLEAAGFSGPPRTWEELKEQAEKASRDGNVRSGFAFQGSEYEGGVCNGCEYIWTHGGNVLDPEDPSKVVVDSPEAIAGMETQRSLLEDGAAPQAVLQYKEDESHAAFLRGDSVFLRNWPYVYALLGNNEESSVKPGQVGVAPLPSAEGQSSSALGGWNFFINAASDKQDEAWEFIRWMTAPEQLKTNALQGSRLPVRRELYEDGEILDKVPVAKLGKETIIRYARPRPVSPYYSDLSLEMAKQFNASLAGDTPPDEAMGTLQKNMQALIEEGEQSR